MNQKSPMLQQLTAWVSEILKIDESQIATDVHIQNLGFTSIELVMLVEKLSIGLDEDIHPGVFLEHTTLERFVDYLLEHKPDAVAHYLSTRDSEAQTNSVSNDNPPASTPLQKPTAQPEPEGWGGIDIEAFTIQDQTDTPTAANATAPLPVIIGGGVAGMLISYSLIEKKIPHILLGKPLLGDAPKLGESMTEAITIEFTRKFKKFEKYFFRKEFTPFFMGNIVAGLRFNFFGTMASLFIDKDNPETFIHVDRIGFDQALYDEVKKAEECTWIEAFVKDVEYDEKTDTIKSLLLSDNRKIIPSFIWDCTNHIRLLGNKLKIPYQNLDAPRKVFFTHYFQKNNQSCYSPEEVPWIHSTSLLRADEGEDNLTGLSWLIPLGHYVSVGISISADKVGKKTPEEVITALTKAYQNRGLDYSKYFPRRKEIVEVPSQHYMYDRFMGKNWALVGGSAASAWFTSASNIGIVACMASMADRILEEPEKYGEHFSRHIRGFLQTQKVYDNLLNSEMGAIDAIKFLSGVVEQARKRLSSFFMFQEDPDSSITKVAADLWEEETVVDKNYFEFLRQIAMHANPNDRKQQTSMIFEKLGQMKQENKAVTLPYLLNSPIRKEKPELFI